MRHANIKTTRDYYANVDEAAVEAVLGPQRNSSRNRNPVPSEAPAEPTDAKPSAEKPCR